MPELPDVAPGEIIASDHINEIAERTIQRYADAADLAAKNPTPLAGELAFLGTGAEGQIETLVYTGSDWLSIVTNNYPNFWVMERANANFVHYRNLNTAANVDGGSIRVRVINDGGGFAIQSGSLDGSIPSTNMLIVRPGEIEVTGETAGNVVLHRGDVTSPWWRFNIQGGAGNFRLQSSPDGVNWTTVETWNPAP